MAEQPDDDLGILEETIVDEGFRAAASRIGTFNLAVFGLTGAGKSTLINAVFGEDLAATGIGEPVTTGSRLYRHESSQLGIFDTRGLEVGSDNVEILRELRAFIEDNRAGALADQIHVVWYCIRAGDRRIQPAEIGFIEQVAAQDIPVLLVMTQTPMLPDGGLHADAVALSAAIEALQLPVWGPVHCINALGDDFAGVPPFGLEQLLDATAQAAPAGVRSALAAAQVVSARYKRQEAGERIAQAEAQLQRQLILPDVGRVWSQLFAEIAAIYQMPPEQAREILERVRTAKRLRELLRRADTGLVVLAAAALTALGVPVPGAPGEEGIPLAYAPDGPDHGQVQQMSGVLAAGPATVALGEAWRETCEHYWSQAFPQPPGWMDPQEVADHFAARVFVRLPQRLQKWEERQRARTPAPTPDTGVPAAPANAPSHAPAAPRAATPAPPATPKPSPKRRGLLSRLRRSRP